MVFFVICALEGERHDFPFITLSPLFKAACFLDDSSIFHYERSPLNGNRGNTHAISHIEKVYYLTYCVKVSRTVLL